MRSSVILKKVGCWHGLEEQCMNNYLLLNDQILHHFSSAKFFFFRIIFIFTFPSNNRQPHFKVGTLQQVSISPSGIFLASLTLSKRVRTPTWAASCAGLGLLHQYFVMRHFIAIRCYEMLQDAIRCCKQILKCCVSRNLESQLALRPDPRA